MTAGLIFPLMYLANSFDPDSPDSWPSMTINGRYASGKTSSLFFFFVVAADDVAAAAAGVIDEGDVEEEGLDVEEDAMGGIGVSPSMGRV